MAPANQITPGWTVVATGTTNYGMSQTTAAKWEDFLQSGGLWGLLTNNDTIVCLDGLYPLANVIGGWTQRNTSLQNLNWKGRTGRGTLGVAEFNGSRDWPWGNSNSSATSTGEVMFCPTGNIGNWTFDGIVFKNVLNFVSPASNTGSPLLGKITMTNGYGKNFEGGFGYTYSSGNGRLNVDISYSKFHAYTRGVSRIWGSWNHDHVVGDSEFMATDPNNPQNPSCANAFDSLPGVATTTWPCTSKASIYRNHAAGVADTGIKISPNGATAITLSIQVNGGTATSTGSISWASESATGLQATLQSLSNVGEDNATVTGTTGGNLTITFSQSLGYVLVTISASTGGSPSVKYNNVYTQGDGLICEENVGTFTGSDIFTYGSGDRGVDLKCAGTLARYRGWGDGTSGFAHHMDNLPLLAYTSVVRAGKRLYGISNSSTCIQASGWIKAMMCHFRAAPPTPYNVLGQNIAISTASVDGSKFQHSLYGGVHQGRNELIDCTGAYTNGATEQTGYTGTNDGANATTANFPVYGLTPGATRNFKVRAVDQAGNRSGMTSVITFTLSSPNGGDVTGPAAPTGLAVTNVTSSAVSMSFTMTPADSGVEIQTAIFSIKALTADPYGYVASSAESSPGSWASQLPLYPGKSQSPVTITGLLPNVQYQMDIAAMDGNGNVGPWSGSPVTFTTASGTPTSSTPGTPTSPGVNPGWVGHPSMAGLTVTKSGTGNTSQYEVLDDDASDVVIGRVFSIPAGSPNGDTPIYIKTGVTAFASV
jgi:hypothetical protein